MTFRVGQKVVCVDAVNDLTNDRIYTVLFIGTLLSFEGEHVPAVTVDQSMFSGQSWPPAFFARRFRPIVERKTSIEIFTAMLNPNKTRVKA